MLLWLWRMQCSQKSQSSRNKRIQWKYLQLCGYTFICSIASKNKNCILWALNQLLWNIDQHLMKLVILSVLFQDCPSRQEIQGSLKQVQKLLSAHEASYLQSLRNLKKKINLLQSNAGKQTTRAINSEQNPQKDWFIQMLDVEIAAILLFFSYHLVLFQQVPAQNWTHPSMGGNLASHTA